MKKYLWLIAFLAYLVLLFWYVPPAWGQPPPPLSQRVAFVAVDPAGACIDWPNPNASPLEYNYVDNVLWGCNNGTWAVIGQGGGGGGSGTTNVLAKWLSSTTIGNSSVIDDGVTTSVTENFSLGTNGLMSAYPNSASGTVAFTLTKLDNSSNAIQLLTTDTTNAYGVCVIGCAPAATSTTALIAVAGQVQCLFDNQTVVRDFVVASTGVGGDCHDAGPIEPTGVQVVGRVVSLNAGAGSTGIIALFSPDTAQASLPVKTFQLANANPGTVLNEIVALTLSNPVTATTPGTAAIGGMIGVCSGGCGNSGTATIIQAGSAQCVIDGATTAGDYLQASTTNAGQFHDAGATYPVPNQVLGRVASTNGGAGTYSCLIFPPESSNPASATIAAGTINDIVKYTAPSAIGPSGCTIDSSNNEVCPGSMTTGSGGGKTGYALMNGKTSGGQGFSVSDAAGTATLYLIPTAPSNGSFLKDIGSATCPTLPSGAPSACEQLSWAAVSGTLSGLTQGEPVIATTATTATSSPAYLDCSAFAGADMSVKIQACLVALNSLNSQVGTADARGFTGAQTWSVNPFAAASLPSSGVLLTGGTTITTSVPVVIPNNWMLQGPTNRAVIGTVGTGIQASGSSFQATYSTGTVTVGTPGINDVITGSGTTWTSSMIGCAFVSPSTQPTGANSTFGIIHAVGSSTSITLGYGQTNGTGAAGGSNYAIYCPVVAMGDGNVSGGNMFGISVRNIGLDCNNVAGCVSLLNWHAEENSVVDGVRLSGFTNIGLDVESNLAQNSGPYQNLLISPGSSGTTSTIPVVIRANNSPLRPFHDMTVTQGASSNDPAKGFDVETSNVEIYGTHVEHLTTAFAMGESISCPVACALPPKGAHGSYLHNINGGAAGTTLVHLNNSIAAELDYVLHDLWFTSGYTNVLIDTGNSCTITDTRLGTYELNHAGTGIAVSTSATCPAATGVSIATTSPITGGTITASGTIACATCATSTPTNHGVAVGSATQALSFTSAGSSGQVLTSNGASADPTFQAAGGGLTCNKYTITQSPFGTTWTVTGQSGQSVTASTTTQTINIVTLVSKTVINALRIATTTGWAGTSMTNVTMSLGTNASGGSTTSFEPAFTVGGTANTITAHSPFGACTASCPSYLDDGGSFSGADNGETVTATFISTGGNLTAMTAGSEDVTLCTTVLP